MCLIVDANAAARFLARQSPVADWLLGKRGNPRLVAAGRLKAELTMIGAVQRLLRVLEQAGRLRSADSAALRGEETRLRASALLRSNDAHVLALAIITGARTLATFDGELACDFRNPAIIKNPRGRIFRNPAGHRHLLGHTPRSCGVR